MNEHKRECDDCLHCCGMLHGSCFDSSLGTCIEGAHGMGFGMQSSSERGWKPSPLPPTCNRERSLILQYKDAMLRMNTS